MHMPSAADRAKKPWRSAAASDKSFRRWNTRSSPVTGLWNEFNLMSSLSSDLEYNMASAWMEEKTRATSANAWLITALDEQQRLDGNRHT